MAGKGVYLKTAGRGLGVGEGSPFQSNFCATKDA